MSDIFNIRSANNRVTVFYVVVILYFLVLPVQMFAQKGTYVTPYGSLQITNIANPNDYSIDGLTLKYPIRYAFGIGYVWNNSDMFGIETGIRYSRQGQRYSGSVKGDLNTGDTSKLIDFKSDVNLNYIQVPLMLRFNSSLEEDKVYMNISAGFQFDILTSATMKVDPAPPLGGSNVYSQFNHFTGSFAANAGLNIMLTKKMFAYAGLQMSRTLGDIEKKSYKYNSSTDPVEYMFPVGIKKNRLPDSYLDGYTSRGKTKNVVYSLMLGISYKIK